MKLEKQQVKVTETCAICGKPIAGKARSDVTRYLSFESRCHCMPAEQGADGDLTDSGVQAQEPALTKEDIEANVGDKFEVLDLVGQGGMGSVYKVRNKLLGKTYAIKVLNPKFVEDAQSVKRFQQEAKAATSLTHPNLAAVYDFGVGKRGAPYLVMDYLDGKDLGEILQHEGFLDQPRALDIFIQIAEAVAHAHSKNVIHRDIKPSNILVCDRDGNDFVKLLDFGIAKVLPSEGSQTRMTQTGEVLGSPLYMSPEQCLGNKIDARSDIYSFGCVMYETLTGVAPFAAENSIKTILRHVNDDAAPISKLKQDYQISASLEQVIMRCLERDADARYQTADELYADLMRVRDGKPVTIRGKSPSRWKDTKAGKITIRLALVSVSLLICFSIALFVRSYEFAHEAHPAVATPTDPYSEADALDARSAALFNQGEYEKAIDLLMFNLHTYKEDGNPQHESYLADCTQHVGKAYLKLGKYTEAQKYYRDALRIYNKWGGYPGGGMWEAVGDYEKVLRAMGDNSAADAMMDAWKTNKNARGYPSLVTIP